MKNGQISLTIFFCSFLTKKDKTVCILTNFHKICIRQALGVNSYEASVKNAINKGKLWNMLK